MRVKLKISVLALSLLLHGAVMAILSVPHTKPVRHNSGRERVLEVRLDAAISKTLLAPSSLAIATNGSSLQASGSNPTTVPAVTDLENVVTGIDSVWAEMLPQWSNSVFSLAGEAQAGDAKIYLAASELDIRPAAQSPIIIPFPDAPLHKRKASAILVLYIGVDGKVDKVEIERSELPAIFEKAAIDTFMQAQMQPGMKDGQPFASIMKVEVDFDSR